MVFVIIFWLIFCSLTFYPLFFNFLAMKKLARKPWQIRIEKSFRPKVSIIVPTYNESKIIRLKLENLTKISYPKEMIQVIVVDSNSNDRTVDIIHDYVKSHKEMDFQVLKETKRRGKSAALNFALNKCNGEIVIVSDADCFWPLDILDKALPYFADPDIGAISGPKILLNPKQSWVSETEDAYLKSVNLVKLGESKIGSTPLFEGGFSAYRKKILHAFDPYNTGSDDCGTIIKIVENNYRAIIIPEAVFFTAFPSSLKERINMKARRTNQLIRVFKKYAVLLLRNRLKNSRGIVLKNIFFYLVSPFMFIPFLITSLLLVLAFPYLIAVLLLLLVPRMRFYAFEIVQGFFVILFSIFSIAIGKRKVVWDIPEDRRFLSEDALKQHLLI